MDECCAPPPLNLGGSKKQDDAYRRVLWAVLAINVAMFAVEVIAGLAAGSAALQADALDFLGDAANYAISLLVVGMALCYRASAALAKGATMAAFGLWVIGTVVWQFAFTFHPRRDLALRYAKGSVPAPVAPTAPKGQSKRQE
jgi:Co/Zn/Cd efflux system component